MQARPILSPKKKSAVSGTPEPVKKGKGKVRVRMRARAKADVRIRALFSIAITLNHEPLDRRLLPSHPFQHDAGQG